MEKKHINTGDILINYLEKKGDGAVIIALHGNSCSSLAWQQFLKDAAGCNYRIIAPDLPGHGDSDKAKNPENDYTIGGLAKIIIKFLDALNIESYFCIGHSLGGHISYNLLVNDKRLRKAITLGAPPFSLPLENSLPLAFIPNPALSGLFKGELTDSEINDIAQCIDPDPQPFVFDAIRKTDPEFRTRMGESIGTLNGVQDEAKAVNENRDRITLIVNKKDALVNADYYKQFNSSICYHVEEETHSPHHSETWMLQVIEGLLPTPKLS
jgi:pimeloyl-ACP methyl ester carboxylesterase